MNRCIHCYRCARFYQQFCGYRDLGALSIGNRTYFGRAASGRLESPFSGNLSDICPTGVYTDKPSRFFGRRWDYQRTPTVCINCSLGCHAVTSVRYRQVARQEARLSPAVNGWFLCDRGRFGFFYASLAGPAAAGRREGRDQRHGRGPGPRPQPAGGPPRRCGRRHRIAAQQPGGSGHDRTGGPTQGLERPGLFCRCRHGPQGENRNRTRWKKGLPFLWERSSRRISSCSPVRIRSTKRRCWRSRCGRRCRRVPAVVVLDPRPVCLPFAFMHVPAAPEALGAVLGRVVKKSIGPEGLDGPAARFLRIPAG